MQDADIVTEDPNANLIPLEDLNATLLSVLMAVLAEHPSGKNLSEDAKTFLCQIAISEDRLNDMEWLEQMIATIEATGVPDTTTKEKEEETEETPKTRGFREVEITHTTELRDDEHLKEVLAKHLLWLDSILDPKSEIHGGRAHLNGITIKDKELASIDLRGADLKKSYFENVDFSGSNLATADLGESTFKSCTFQGTKLRRVIFHKTLFDQCDLRGADLKETELTSVNWEDCQMDESFQAEENLESPNL